ncbi:MAG: hypothetical protein DI571_08455, partial [Arsenicicoccus sp.]
MQICGRRPVVGLGGFVRRWLRVVVRRLRGRGAGVAWSSAGAGRGLSAPRTRCRLIALGRAATVGRPSASL